MFFAGWTAGFSFGFYVGLAATSTVVLILAGLIGYAILRQRARDRQAIDQLLNETRRKVGAP